MEMLWENQYITYLTIVSNFSKIFMINGKYLIQLNILYYPNCSLFFRTAIKTARDMKLDVSRGVQPMETQNTKRQNRVMMRTESEPGREVSGWIMKILPLLHPPH